MPPITFPNQRMVRVHRERAASDFLGIKNENWQAASRDLGAHALQLYLYLASNANNYTVALSPVAVRQAIGMARSTYHDQFHKLVDRGYLVPSTGNTFEFYEVPQAATQTQKEVSADGLDFEEIPSHGEQGGSGGQSVLPEDIEINNNNSIDNSEINNANNPEVKETIRKPEVKEIVISRPVAAGKNRPKPIPKGEFVF
ncbi:MAG: hypothetical protein J6J18_04025 [Oscillospiraceae bacterium]|nr:hypothetical protein [Oscillospiraceae bacterium]